MSRINHILRELGRSLYRNPGTVLGAVLSLAMLFLLFDLYWITSETSNRLYSDLLSDVRIEAFVNDGVDDIEIPMVMEKISEIEGIFAIGYISKDSARIVLQQMLGTDLLADYNNENPLPRSFVLEVDKMFLNSKDMDIISSEIAVMPEILEVKYSREWLVKAEQMKSVIIEIGLALGILILLTALISLINNIRLMTRARAVGFQQMRLLGAGKLFLAFPFLLEGLFISGLAALIGWGAIYYSKEYISLTQINIVYPKLEDIVIYCLVAAVLGSISGYLGIRRLLK